MTVLRCAFNCNLVTCNITNIGNWVYLNVIEITSTSLRLPGGPCAPPGGDIYLFANRWGSTNGSTFGVVSGVRSWQNRREIQGNAVAHSRGFEPLTSAFGGQRSIF